MNYTDPVPPFFRRFIPLWAVLLVAVGICLLFWFLSGRDRAAAELPELTRAERRHLDRRSAQLGKEGEAHYAQAQALLHEPIIPGDSAARLAAFDSTVRSW